MTAKAAPNRGLLSGALGGLTLTGVGILVSLTQFSILLRRLPLEIAGIWMIFTNLGSYVLFLDLGLSPTLGREVSFALGEPGLSESERADRVGTLIRSCTILVCALAVFVALLGSLGGWAYLRTIVPVDLALNTRSAWFIYMLGAALNLVGEGWFAGIYGLGRVFQEKMVRSAGAGLGLLFLSIAVFSGSGFRGLAVAYLAQSVCTIVMARIMLTRFFPLAVTRGNFDQAVIQRLIGPSLKYAATLLGGILILQTDNLVIASVLGPSRVPDYQAVAKMVTILMSLSMMLVMTSTPITSQAYARGDLASVVQLLGRNLRFSLSVMTILGGFLACFTDRIVEAWLGPGRFVGFSVVWVLLIVMLLEAHHQAMGAATMATGRIVFVVPALIAGVINILTSVVLARHFGLVGVVCGTMVAQIATNNWYVPFFTMRLFNIDPLQHLRSVILPIFFLLTIVVGTAYGVRILTNQLPDSISVSLGAACVAAVGIACVYRFVFDREERAALLSRLRVMGLRWTKTTPSDLPM